MMDASSIRSHPRLALQPFSRGGIKSGLEARGDRYARGGVGGDGATFDIGFGALSASAERNENIIYVCYDNEAYMNTGNQRSGATQGVQGRQPTLSPR
jgi:pyruvate/2-oxoacid:ferredoxin oxidoreductase beta subunit